LPSSHSSPASCTPSPHIGGFTPVVSVVPAVSVAPVLPVSPVLDAVPLVADADPDPCVSLSLADVPLVDVVAAVADVVIAVVPALAPPVEVPPSSPQAAARSPKARMAELVRVMV